MYLESVFPKAQHGMEFVTCGLPAYFYDDRKIMKNLHEIYYEIKTNRL